MPALTQLTDGLVVPAAQINALFPINAYKGGDQIVNNSAGLVNDSALVWTPPVSATFEFRLTLIINSNTTANFKYAFTFPAGARLDFGHIVYNLGGAANTIDLRGFPNYTSGTAISISGAGTDAAYFIHGTLTMGATSGNLQFQWAQNTATAVNSIVRGGSAGSLRQVA